jgi:ABC-type transporter Mla maintaining outer membrane lipid asymmetry ATPase subunit MlaF
MQQDQEWLKKVHHKLDELNKLLHIGFDNGIEITMTVVTHQHNYELNIDKKSILIHAKKILAEEE